MSELPFKIDSEKKTMESAFGQSRRITVVKEVRKHTCEDCGYKRATVKNEGGIIGKVECNACNLTTYPYTHVDNFE